MKRAASSEYMEVIMDDAEVMPEIVMEMPDMKRQKIKDEVYHDDGIMYQEEIDQQLAPQYQNLIIQHMDITQPLCALKQLLETRLQCSLAEHQFYLQDSIELNDSRSLVDQCVQGEGMVQVNLEIKSQPGVKPRINILDILKTTEDEMEEKYVTDQVIQSNENQNAKVVDTSEESENVTRWVIDQGFRREQLRLKIPLDPADWSEIHVNHWIQWAVKKFNLQEVQIDAFNFNGEQLCAMTHTEFVEYFPIDPCDLFWTHLELLRKCKFVAIMQQPTPYAITITSSDDAKYGKAKSLGRPKPRVPRLAGEDRISPGNRTGNNGQIQLWQFLLELLTDKVCREVIAWIGDGGEFKLMNPEVVAQMWGQRKNKPSMNYEKLSRALRYYYDGDMITKDRGKRFVYRFVCDLKLLVGYSAAELSRLVNTDDISLIEKHQSQHYRSRPSYIATMKADTEAAEVAARLIEQQTATSHILDIRTQLVQTLD